MSKTKDKQLYICNHSNESKLCIECMHNKEHEAIELCLTDCNKTALYCYNAEKETKCVKVK